MSVLIVYVWVQCGLEKVNYAEIEHESVESALAVFKQQNPHLIPIAAREIVNAELYI